MKNHLRTSCLVVLCLFVTSTLAQQLEGRIDADHTLLTRVDSLIASYQFEEAQVVLSMGDSLDVQVLLRIGLCHFRLGASLAAIRPYERVLQVDSSNITALNQLGQLYARDGEYEKAFSSFIKLIEIDSTNGFYCKQAGFMALRANYVTRAKFWLRKALQFNPADTEASLGLGNLLMEQEQYAAVDSITRWTLSVEPNFKPMLLLSAKSAFEQQNYVSVIGTLKKLLEKTDTTALIARLLGVSYFHLQQYDSVISCMQFLLKNRYDYEWIYYYMGVSFRALGDVPGSISWFKLAVQKSISENTKTYYAQLGQSYEEAGDYQSAIRAYRAAYNYSQDGIMLYHLARNYDVYYRDKTTALEYYKKYLESDDTIRLAREYARKRMQDMGHF
jgi:tetratricopeptide (TPR) repeat protein